MLWVSPRYIPYTMVGIIQNPDSGSWIISHRNIGMHLYQSPPQCKTQTSKCCGRLEYHRFGRRRGSTFQWCFYGCNHSGNVKGFPIEIVCTRSMVTFIGSQGQQPLLCALSTADSLSYPASIGSTGGISKNNISGLTIFMMALWDGVTVWLVCTVTTTASKLHR